MTSDLFDAMRTMRTIRRFEMRPIPDEVLTEIVTAATWAPSGSNSQPWGFVIVRDPALKRSLRDWYLDRFERMQEVYRAQSGHTRPASPRILRRARHLAEHLDEAPVLVFPCVDKHRYPAIFDDRGETRDPTTLYASILPAVQNLLLAARAHGIGGCLTTMLRFADADVRRLLALPDHVMTTVMIPLGYGRDSFGPLTRRPATEVMYLDRWGDQFATSASAT